MPRHRQPSPPAYEKLQLFFLTAPVTDPFSGADSFCARDERSISDSGTKLSSSAASRRHIGPPQALHPVSGAIGRRREFFALTSPNAAFLRCHCFPYGT